MTIPLAEGPLIAPPDGFQVSVDRAILSDVLGQRGPFGKGTEASKRHQPLVKHLGHGLLRTPDAPRLEGRQSPPEARCRGGHVSARQRPPVHLAVKVEGLGNEQEQDRSAEGGVEWPWRQIQLPDIGNLCRVGANGVDMPMVGTPGQPGAVGARRTVATGGPLIANPSAVSRSAMVCTKSRSPRCFRIRRSRSALSVPAGFRSFVGCPVSMRIRSGLAGKNGGAPRFNPNRGSRWARPAALQCHCVFCEGVSV